MKVATCNFLWLLGSLLMCLVSCSLSEIFLGTGDSARFKIGKTPGVYGDYNLGKGKTINKQTSMCWGL